MAAQSVISFADTLNELVPGLMREFGRRQVQTLTRGNITYPQFFVIEHIVRSGGATMTECARFMKVSTAAMTGFVERLVAAGHCRRLHDRRDRRIIRIKATSRGAKLVRKINQERRKMIISVFGRLSAKEREDYLRIIRRVHDIMAARRQR